MRSRPLDLGIEPYLVASSVVGVLAQRLVRRICPDCGKSYQPNDTELKWLSVPKSAASRMRQGAGCASCRQTGYRGRLGTFELLVLDDEVRKLVASRATATAIKDAGLRSGTRTLRDDGIEKILAGFTTIAEVERVTLEPEFIESAAAISTPAIETAVSS